MKDMKDMKDKKLFHEININEIKSVWIPDNDPVLTEKYTKCECNKMILTRHLNNHLKSIYHNNYIENQVKLKFQNKKDGKDGKDMKDIPYRKNYNVKKNCSCGCVVASTSMTNHLKSKKHALFLDVLKEQKINIDYVGI